MELQRQDDLLLVLFWGGGDRASHRAAGGVLRCVCVCVCVCIHCRYTLLCLCSSSLVDEELAAESVSEGAPEETRASSMTCGGVSSVQWLIATLGACEDTHL